MGNSLTGLYPTIFQALNNVSRELVGFIPAVLRNTGAERAAVGQSVGWPVVAAQSTVDIEPAATGPDPAAMSSTLPTATITKSKGYPFYLTGEEQLGLRNSSTLEEILRQHFENAFRQLVNEIEADLFAAMYKAASRAYGTPATTPFGTGADLSDLAQVRLILDDNGAPSTDLHLIMSNMAAANLRGKQSSLFKSNEAGSDTLLRTGSLTSLPLEGFNLHQSGQIVQHTKGTGTAYQTSGAVAKGAKTIAVDTGANTVLAGDVVTFAGDSNNYVVNTALSAGSLAIGAPGARAAIGNDVAMTVGNSYTPNVAMHRQAGFLVARPPAVPDRDSALDSMLVTDPISGLTFDVRHYGQFYRETFLIAIAWGVKAVNSEHIALLMG